MALKSTTLTIPADSSSSTVSKEQLLQRHHRAMKKVINDARDFKEDRERALDQISDTKLRESASR